MSVTWCDPSPPHLKNPSLTSAYKVILVMRIVVICKIKKTLIPELELTA